MEVKIRKIIREEDIHDAIKKIARRIESDYKDEEVLLVGILKGSFVFLSHLILELKIQHQVDFIGISSYGKSTKSTGVVRVLFDMQTSPVGKNIVVVDDIVDTGLTLDYLKRNLLTRNPKSLKFCVLFDKKENRLIPFEPDYTGIVVPNKFLVGFGMDYKEYYRGLPFVGVLEE